MNRQQDQIADRCDRGQRQLTAKRNARRLAHTREAMADVFDELAPLTQAEDRVLRLKVEITVHAEALKALVGPERVVAFLGSIAGHHSMAIKKKARRG